MIDVSSPPTPADLLPAIERMWQASAGKIERVDRDCPADRPSPVFTADGRYTARGWTDWTRGFQHGSAILQHDATGDERFLDLGIDRTLHAMRDHLTHIGVHDHGFTIVSTFGNLWRLAREGRWSPDDRLSDHLVTALRVSGAVQAARWSEARDGLGYIASFNGKHSLFVDTIRTCRALVVAHLLGHTLHAEQDASVSLLGRMITHARTTARFNIWYGRDTDAYDVRGRTAHEALFNTANGVYRAPSTQQGYSPFSTWTRGLAWAIAGYPEQLEFVLRAPDTAFEPFGGKQSVVDVMLEAARATADFFIEHSPVDGVPYWDTGAPGLAQLPGWADRASDPFNEHEPIDSSAAAIACQGLVRLAAVEDLLGNADAANRYRAAGLVTLRSLLDEPYLSTDDRHHGLLLHSIYHRPNNWDHIPAGSAIPRGEACMWGDYHLREASLLVQRLANGRPGPFFFGTAEIAGACR